MLLVAILPLPYGYYVLLRFVVTGIAGFFAYEEYTAKHQGWMVTFGIIAVLFNPFIPIHLTRSIWLPINMIVSGIFATHWWHQRRPD